MSEINDTIIIGAGISGLSVGAFLKQKNPNIDMLILEKSDRPGGVIKTHMENGFLMEWGAHGFLDNAPASRQLLDFADVQHLVQKAPLANFVRYICLNSKLALIPQTPPKIIFANLISWTQKFRVIMEIFKKPLLNDPTVKEWSNHRFGSALEPFVDAVFTGTYAGDIEKLSIDAVMPGIRQLEKNSGSVIMGLLHKRKLMKQSKENKPQKLELPAMTSFVEGMETFPKLIANKLTSHIRYQTKVKNVNFQNGFWQISTDEKVYKSKHLIIATPINIAIELLNDITTPIEKLPEAHLATVGLGFESNAKIPFGFGYLAPKKENRFALGTLFSTHMFPGRAPKNKQFVEVLVGGSRNPEYLQHSDEQMIDQVYKDISQLMVLPDRPVFSKVLRTKVGIPQLVQGYYRYLDWRQNLKKQYKNLHIIGFGWDGIGINDMIKEAMRTSEEIISGDEKNKESEVKGVYF